MFFSKDKLKLFSAKQAINWLCDDRVGPITPWPRVIGSWFI